MRRLIAVVLGSLAALVIGCQAPRASRGPSAGGLDMTLRAGFAEVDITPPLGVHKIGWTDDLVADKVLDPLYARIAIFESGGQRIGVVALDLLGVAAPRVAAIRSAGAAAGIPPGNLMVACTHNHAGPAIDPETPLPTDEAYLACMHDHIAGGLKRAADNLRPAHIGAGSAVESRISFVRRFHMVDGSVQCQPGKRDQIRCNEGVLDPQVGVICVKDAGDKVIGLLVNFACHACHHGGDTSITAGFPGRLAIALKEAYGEDCTVVFLNGAFGNVHHFNYLDPKHNDDMTRMGRLLAQDVQRVVSGLGMSDRAAVSARSVTLQLPLRNPDGPYGAAMRYRQLYGSEDLYRAEAVKLRGRYAQSRHWPGEVQCLSIGPDTALVGMPGEYFSDDGLRIKMASRLPHIFVVGQANDKIGYIPSRKCFDGGGYETTLAGWSKLREDAADILAETALDLLGRCQ